MNKRGLNENEMSDDEMRKMIEKMTSAVKNSEKEIEEKNPLNRTSTITKKEIENLTIDLNTKSDEEIWKMFK